MKRIIILLSGLLLLAGIILAQGQTILIEAESFDYTGGWMTDQQFIEQMGSPILLAHGIGTPVGDARTEVNLPTAGKYRVWVRTRDWVAPWKAPGAPGRFQVIINGTPVKTIFGTEGAEWHWQDGGTVSIDKTAATIALHDLTGFDGRCDAIILSGDLDWTPPEDLARLKAFRHKMLNLPDEPEEAGKFDLVVVGGGMAGATTAVSAARLGLKVALIQNRPVLGGNNSSEVRVHLGGNINQEPYPALGDVVNELDSGGHGNAEPAAAYDDEKKLRVVKGEPNIKLFLNTHALDVEMDGKRIKAIIAQDIPTGRILRYESKLVADCTGDGTIGFRAGADYHMGREARSVYGESTAPEKPDMLVMGSSIMWYAVEVPEPVSFPDIEWGIGITEETVDYAIRGNWNWETGMNKNQIEEAELIRDYGMRAAYSNWSFLKNDGVRKEEFANQRLEWVAFVAGKRESRRLMGDVVLKEQDITEQRQFPDSAITATWSIDLHYARPDNAKHFPGWEYRTYAVHGKKKPYAIPYRCLYSRNIENLFMAGRNISVSHVALGTIRVMRTTGMMGEVVGMAASLCKKHDTTPRGVYENHFDELKSLMEAGVGKKQ